MKKNASSNEAGSAFGGNPLLPAIRPDDLNGRYQRLYRASVPKLLLMMKLLSLFLVIALLSGYVKGTAQNVTLSGKDLTLKQVFRVIEKQTSYVVFGKEDFFSKSKPVTLNVRDLPLSALLEKVLKDQGISFELDASTLSIVLSRIPAPLADRIDLLSLETPRILVTGTIVDTLGNPLSGASVQVKGRAGGVVSDKLGRFFLEAKEKDRIVVSFVGYEKYEFPVGKGEGNWVIVLRPSQDRMENVEVVSNGYQQLPKERATGSFTVINREMLNRSTGPDILTRLEGITNGLLFNRTVAQGEDVGEFQLESRGRATIMSESTPLIVLDNFPFEGNIRDINPNDVESVTVLRDAAAASIWGARAGNGVIVITTRQGNYNRKAEISISATTNIFSKPDLFYDRRFMPSEMVMQIEKEKFERGDWLGDENLKFSFSPYAELLIKRRDHLISEEDFLAEEQRMKNTDVRNDALKYLYRNALQQQYSMNINGGSNVNKYFFSVGYDKIRSAMVGDDDRRLTLNMQNSFKPVKNLEITTRLTYTRTNANKNAFNITDLGTSRSGLRPYTRLVDENGKPVAVERNIRTATTDEAEAAGMLPWHFSPLEEIGLSDNTATGSFLNLLGNVRYQLMEGININATYQYTESNNSGREYYAPETYYVRNLVNLYTQPNGTMPVPYGGILSLSNPLQQVQHSGRIQVNGQRNFGEHDIAVLGGAEIRQSVDQSFPGSILYDYDEDLGVGTSRMDFTKTYLLYTSSGATIPGPDQNTYYKIDRYLSYFANASHTFRSKYILSGSARWDGSNLFGVKTNQKGTLLWSAGASWELSAEDFFKAKWVDYLRLRSTYGSSGNVNKGVSAYPVIDYSASSFVDPNLERYASITSPGNPSLKWERVATFNIGVDWSVFNRRVSGSLEFFTKKANDLIGDAFIPPSTGIGSANNQIRSYRFNYAALRTNGIDLQVTTKNLVGPLKWQTTWIVNFAKDKVTDYYNSGTLLGVNYVGLYGFQTPLEIGRSVSGIYAFPWNGLDPSNGRVKLLKDGQSTTDYAGYLASVKPGDMVYAGVTSPVYYGSILNNLEWKRLQLSILLTWKAGYVYRRSTLFPGMEYEGIGSFHADILQKWKKPGDELVTNVPAGGGLNGYDRNEATVYMYSNSLIARGDHIAIQDINLSYSVMPGNRMSGVFKSARIFLYARNLGFLWKADRNNVDPSMPNARYPQPKQFSAGVQLAF